MHTFLVVRAGQLVSLVGTNLTGLALAIFVYNETGSVTQLSFIMLATQVPQLVMTPFAGAFVDRWDRRIAMIVSDTGAGLSTLLIAGLLITDRLSPHRLYCAPYDTDPDPGRLARSCDCGFGVLIGRRSRRHLEYAHRDHNERDLDDGRHHRRSQPGDRRGDFDHM